MQRTYFIYRYIRLDTNQPFYIGKGTVRCVDKWGYPVKSYRIRYWRAFDKVRNHICKGIMAKTKYEIEIIYEHDDLLHICEKEKEFIGLYGVVFDGSGTLVNLTTGGEGCYRIDPEARKRHVAIRHKNGTYVAPNMVAVHMYEPSGEYIESFQSMHGFHKKYGVGNPAGEDVCCAATIKKSLFGYLFSRERVDRLSASEYKITRAWRMPIVEYSENMEPTAVYPSMLKLSKATGVGINTVRKKIGRGELRVNDKRYRVVNILELPKLKLK